MSSDLTLPGTIPGLLRKCSPVVITSGHPHDIGTASVVVGQNELPHPEPLWLLALANARLLFDGREISLDLTDATGRAHAAWWLASKLDAGDPTSETLYFVKEQPDRVVMDPEGYHVDVENGCEAFWMCAGDAWSIGCDALGDLDDEEAGDRRLPDGSRWIDAEALRRVVLHVAGVPA